MSSRDIILQTADLKAATAFYEGALGLKVFERSADLVGFDAGAFRLFVEEGVVPGPVFELLVDNYVATKYRLIGQGCMVIDDNPQIPRCYLRDPFGLTFNLASKPETASFTPTEAEEVR